MGLRPTCRLLRETEGQALTEFAIVVPIIIMVLMFSIWFSELVTIKLKMQEAARYMAWETTSYPMHDYSKGGNANSSLSTQAMSRASSEASKRYADLDSTTTTNTGRRIFSAAFTKPIFININWQEEAAYGGAIVNLIFNVAMAVVDLFSAMSFKSGNYVAMALVALGKDWGGARTARMFGSSEWGFNRSGYVETRVYTYVTNKWLGRGILWGNKDFTVKGPFVVEIKEKHGVLADSWRLNDGGSVYGGDSAARPGAGSKVNKTAFWKQVDRIFFVNQRTRSVGKGIINAYKVVMRLALGLTLNPAQPVNLNDNDFMQTAVVSRNYGKDSSKWKSEIAQDRGSTKKYDTAPACGAGGSSCPGGDSLKPYGETRDGRGEYFMGCKQEMLLGCPSGTMSQSNPFGDYVLR